MSDLRTMLDGLAFPEGARWHEDRLWFAEKRADRVVRVDDGALTTVVEVAGSPAGLGWLPDGRLLVVSMAQQAVFRLDDTGLTLVADLRELSVGRCNDMVVDAEGRAYVGHFGYDLAAGAPPAPASLVLVEPDGRARTVADGLDFPNGAVVTPDGSTLIVAETSGNRITAFDVDTDGSLAGRRTFAELPGTFPDGICLDAEGAVWLADPLANEVARVADGKITDRISTGDRGAFDCELGGADGRTLFVCTYTEEASRDPSGPRVGRIEAVDVAVPAA